MPSTPLPDETTETRPEQNTAAQSRTEMLSNSTNIRFLDKLQVLRLLSVSPTALHDLMIKAEFPRPIVLHADPTGISGKSYWFQHEVEQWMLSRPRRVLQSDRKKEVA